MTAPWQTPPAGRAADRAAALVALIPRIETERLILRAPTLAEGEAYAAIYTSDRWLHDERPDAHEAWLDFNFVVASWLLRGYGAFAIEDRATGALLGFVMLDHEFSDPEPEIGWALTAEATGRGIATEAARAALGYATSIGLAPVAYVWDRNAGSAAVATRLGGVRDAAAEATLGPDMMVWRFPTPTFREGTSP